MGGLFDVPTVAPPPFDAVAYFSAYHEDLIRRLRNAGLEFEPYTGNAAQGLDRAGVDALLELLEHIYRFPGIYPEGLRIFPDVYTDGCAEIDWDELKQTVTELEYERAEADA